VQTKVYDLLRGILEGNDRSVLIDRSLVPLSLPRQQMNSPQSVPAQ